MAVEVQNGGSVPSQLPPVLGQLSDEVDAKIHLLASSGDEVLAAKALQSAKEIFELGLKHEATSHPHLHPFLLQVMEPPSVSLRSKTKKNKAKSPTPPPVDPDSILPYTPLTELTVDGLDIEQIWAQLELRTEGIVKICKELGPGDNVDDMDKLAESDLELESDEDEDDGSDEEMTEEEWKQMLLDNGIDENEDSEEGSGSDDEDEDDEDGDSEMDSEDEENMIKWKDEMSGSEDEEGSDEELDELEDQGEEDEDEWEDEDEDVSVGEEDEENDDDDDDEDMEEEDDEEDGEDDKNALFGDEPGPSRRPKHPTLDDDFFSIDEFNRLTEEAEAGRLTSGKLGGDDDDEDEDDLGDAGALMLQAGPDDDDDIMYKDFFAAPRGSKPTSSGKGKGKGKDTGKKDKKGKGKSKGVSFDEEDEEMLEEDDVDEEEEGGRDIMGRFKGDLFDSDDEEDGAEKNLSTHEKQQQALARQIAELEQEAVGPKDWTLLGEATSRARPENSLLEEDLDFEQMGKVVPVVTEDRVKSLEELIKKRIIDNNFDSTVRVRAYEPTPYLPSRYFDLQDSQSSKSLAQIYEEEYQAAASGSAVKDPRDEKLRKEHDEIDNLWNDICYKLDALSSLNFVPKQPKAQITTVDNLPTASMESALPPTSAATSLLAPEEMFAPPKTTQLVARSELNPEEAQAARLKRKRDHKADRKRLGEMAELYGKRKGSVKEQKDRAMKDLVKTGKGVTVVGKGAKEMGKAAKRAAAGEENKKDGKRLKL